MLLKAANVGNFDALGQDFDKHHLDMAAVSDRLSHVLRCMLVLDEEATLALDLLVAQVSSLFHSMPLHL